MNRMPILFTMAVSTFATAAGQAPSRLEEVLRIYRQVVLASDDAISVLDRDYRYRLANPAFRRRYGAAPMIGRRFVDLFDEASFARVKPYMERCFAGETVSFEDWFDYPRAGRIYVQVRYSPLREDDGAVSGIVVCVRDGTERRRAEEALRESEQRFRDLVEGSLEGITIEDSRGRCLFASQAFAVMLGYRPEELVGLPALAEVIAPHERERWWRLGARRFGGGEAPELYRIDVLHRDGSTVHCEVRTRLVSARGEPFTQTTWLDITGRERAEEALRTREQQMRAIVDHSPAEIFLKDTLGRYVFVGRHTHAKFGLAPEAMLGKRPSEVFGEGLGGAFERHDRAVLDGGCTVRREVEAELADGMHTLLDTKFPVRGEDGQVIGLANVSIDITERKRAEQALRRSREELRNLALRLQAVREEERTAIAREIHDELGQALTGLKIDLAWLTERLPECAAALEERARSMLSLIDDTMDRVRRISASLRPAVLDDLGLAAAVEWMAGEFAARTGIACTLEVDDVPSPDEERATAVFRNLQEALTNVSRHAGAGRVAVTLHSHGGSYELEVEDDGVGISTEALASSRSIGLIGMRERAAALGGTVDIGRRAEGGTSVHLSLPLGGAQRA